MKTEKILSIILAIGLTLRFFDIAGGSFFTVVTMALLAFFYFPLGFYFLSDKKIDNKTVVFSIITGLLLSTLVMGILFKVMHWPGATFTLLCGIVTCIPIAVISYLNYSKPKQAEQISYYKNIFIRVIVFIILGLLSFLL